RRLAKVSGRWDGRTLNQAQGLGGPSTVGVIAAIHHRLRDRALGEVELRREIGREHAELGPGPRAPAARAAHGFPDLLPSPPRLHPHPPHSLRGSNTMTDRSSSSEKWGTRPRPYPRADTAIHSSAIPRSFDRPE